ncbi:MAG TPA: GNAT family N-acetyltransferase [Gemmatimonadales bacterium]|nr:GNAT family N-acetyltransferase [Gemmatimonadales bacterium]
MHETFTIRLATPADAATLARHRVSMFRDMADLPPDQAGALESAARRDLQAWLETGTYVGWVASPADRPAEIIAGAGVQLRPLLPRPRPGHPTIREGPEGIVLNVYTERRWRRRGVARRLMETIIAWTHGHGVARLVLHASPEGRPLYEQIGFEATNEMRYTREL